MDDEERNNQIQGRGANDVAPIRQGDAGMVRRSGVYRVHGAVYGTVLIGLGDAMSLDINDMIRELADVDSKIGPLLIRQKQLHREIDDARSRRFIAANNITIDDVALSSGGGQPWHWTFAQFGEYLTKTKCMKKWAEWNGRLYNAHEVMAGYMTEYAIGRIEHVPGYKS